MFAVGSCSVHCRMLSSVSVLYPSDASSTIFPSCDNPKSLQLWKCPWGLEWGEQNLFQLRPAVLEDGGVMRWKELGSTIHHGVKPCPLTCETCNGLLQEQKINIYCVKSLKCGREKCTGDIILQLQFVYLLYHISIQTDNFYMCISLINITKFLSSQSSLLPFSRQYPSPTIHSVSYPHRLVVPVLEFHVNRVIKNILSCI